MDCPVNMNRARGVLAFTVHCSPDLHEPHADILLGEELTIQVHDSDAAIAGATWSGRTVVASSNGWDSWGTAQLSWSDMGHAVLLTTLDTYSLDMGGEGAVGLVEGAP